MPRAATSAFAVPSSTGTPRSVRRERDPVVAELGVGGHAGDRLVGCGRRGERRFGKAGVQVVVVAEIGAEEAERGRRVGQQSR